MTFETKHKIELTLVIIGTVILFSIPILMMGAGGV